MHKSGTTPPLLALHDIVSAYGAVNVHHNLNLEVGRGEIVCLLGGNASGKSTTLKIISGLLAPSAGAVFFDGHEITPLPTHVRVAAGLALVPEGRRVFADMSVKDTILMGAYCRGRGFSAAQALAEMLEIFKPLASRLHQRAGTLSGGEQQMVALARALIAKTVLLCMDEPTMGLSPRWVDVILDLVHQLPQRGVSVFMVEQNARLALSIADRGLVLQNGRIILEGTAAELLLDNRVQSAYLNGE